MQLEEYDYDLPTELIAQSPSDERSSSRLMVVTPTAVEHRRFRDVVEYLREGDVLVINESKVIPARLLGKKQTGGRVELILTHKEGDCYEAIVKGKVREGTILLFSGGLSARVIEKREGFARVQFSRKLTDVMLANLGKLPIPPYVKNPVSDESRYQTVYGSKKGSIASHTAGLHFTPELLAAVRKKGVKIARVCLHISYSTFLPIRGEIEKHQMHAEHCEISKKDAEIINKRTGRLIAVGTTSVKTLESLSDAKGVVHASKKESELFIYPPYRFKVKIDGLITNFHFPKSTLLLLVSAYYGRDRMLALYREAIQKKYRFYSFGDAMLLLKEL